MPSIYLISPEQIPNPDEFTLQLEEIFALHEKPALFQLRLKGCEKSYIEKTMEKLLPVCKKHGVDFVINDYASLALKYGVALHVGSDDATIQQCIAFKKAGGGHLGVSCYNSLIRAKEFEEIADCISFGAMFGSETKPNAKNCEIDVVREYAKHNPKKEIAIIGGINAQTIEKLGEILPIVSYVCVISCIWN